MLSDLAMPVPGPRGWLMARCAKDMPAPINDQLLPDAIDNATAFAVHEATEHEHKRRYSHATSYRR